VTKVQVHSAPAAQDRVLHDDHVLAEHHGPRTVEDRAVQDPGSGAEGDLAGAHGGGDYPRHVPAPGPAARVGPYAVSPDLA